MNQEIEKTEARQGVTGTKLRWVLLASFALALVILAIVLFVFAG